MKILHVLDVSIPRLKGYTIRSQGIIESQARIGLNPVVITSPRQENLTASREIINGIVYYRCGSISSRIKVPFLSELLEIKFFSREIEKVIKKEKIDLLHAHSPVLCGMAASMAAKKYSLPIVYEIRAFWEDAAVSSGKCKYNSLRYKITRGLETRLCKKVNKIITICNGLKNDLIDRGIKKEKIEIVPNGIFLESFKERTKSKELLQKYQLDGCVVLGFIGSFFRFEGVSLLVKLMAQINDSSIKMVLVGDGEEYENIKRYIKDLGVEKHVILTGRIPHDAIMDYYSIIDIFIYPRLNERITELTTPLKPLETMAMKKNIIISDVGGLKELVPEICGQIFIAGDVEDLKKKVEKNLFEEERRKNQVANAYEFVQKRDWKKLVERYSEIYNYEITF
ncbi:MAG: glycosyltransferase [Deltaproteobacteria bacterium]|nr:glycosyltransferase [Deltaproteobacteria bacterium]